MTKKSNDKKISDEISHVNNFWQFLSLIILEKPKMLFLVVCCIILIILAITVKFAYNPNKGLVIQKSDNIGLKYLKTFSTNK